MNYYLLHFTYTYQAEQIKISAYSVLNQDEYDLFQACAGEHNDIPLVSSDDCDDAKLQRVLPLGSDTTVAKFVESTYETERLKEWMNENAPVYLLSFVPEDKDHCKSCYCAGMEDQHQVLISYFEHHARKIDQVVIDGVKWIKCDKCIFERTEFYDQDGELKANMFSPEEQEWMNKARKYLK